jgi:DNA end-binding protein Ku
MAPARPYWKGYLRLSLVSCPIALYTATSSTERVSFRQINRKTGNRLRQQMVDEATREPVDSEDKARGYEYAKNSFIIIDDEELEAIEVESNHTIEIDSFIPRADVDERFHDSPYYLVPNDAVGVEAFAVIREAMRGKKMAALGRVVLAKRERVIMLQPWDRGLLGTTLRYPYEVRDAKEYFDDIPDVKLAPDMLKLAEHIIATKEAEFDPSKFVDHYEEAVVAMLKEKQAGLPVRRDHAAVPPPNVINLMDALKRSIAGHRTAASFDGPAVGPKKGKKRAEGQREMLLPLPGKKAKEPEVAKPAVKASSRRKKAG